jgi:hypothetical protein
LRKKLKIFNVMSAIVIVILALGTSSIAKSEFSVAQKKAESFTEQVLPIDKSQYNITLDGYNVLRPPDVEDSELNNLKQEYYRYSFVSDQSELSVTYKFENDFFTTCVVTVLKGAVLTDHPGSNLNDAVLDFLQRYQTFTGLDTSDMRYMVSNAEVMQNQTLILGDLKLKITNEDSPSLGHGASLMWYRVINGCEYLQLSLGFTDGVFIGLRDIRKLYPIGNTTVDVSKEQAIDIAMKYIRENYTYEMPGNVWIKDFKVLEQQTMAVLSPTVRNSTQYPTWIITFTLDHTYPGSVVGLIVIVSAATGEVMVCSNQAVGGSAAPSNDNTNVVVLPSPSPLLSSPPSSPMTNEVSSTDMETTLMAVVAVVALVFTLTLVTLFIRKRSK